jgi:hypothetical protein
MECWQIASITLQRQIDYHLSLNRSERWMCSKQDEPDDNVVAIADGLELMRAFRRIAGAEGRRKVIELAVALAPKQR